ncbi:hypothetical protein [Actinophytocola xanthii]|uniref:Prenyltransferase n=1 Tax=Actinophytocola xanthii TaxID=1912961 RepID=A0A1Q8CNL4_9PSEU|nr:hypothetical protein [Actinophytocola xanthii]OLF15947.1 hypothetical protein BU204_18740 [Actinophytocola xanthii]
MNDTVGGARTGGPRTGSVSRAVRGYLASRFPLPTQGTAIVLTFVSAQLLLDRAVGPVGLRWTGVLGVASFVLLFLQLRLVDDIDDLEQDGGAAGHTRSGLTYGWLTVVVGIVALNLLYPPALGGALAAVALTVLTPFWVKRRLTTRRVPLAVCYETIPLVVMAYPVLFWLSEGGVAPAAAPTAAVVVLFWAAYEFWKFSRKAPDLDYRPYRLGRDGVRAVLLALLCCAAACVATIVVTLPVTWFFIIYQSVLLGLLIAWTAGEWAMAPPAARASRLARALGLAGLIYAVLLQFGVIVEALLWTVG